MADRSLDKLVLEFSQSLPPVFQDIRSQCEEHFRLSLAFALQKLDLVTREEFDVQTQVLAKTRQKLEKLEQKLTELEALANQARLNT